MAPANGDITTQVALLNQRVGDLIAKLDELEKDLRDLHEMASRWKGGFLVIVGLIELPS